MERKGILTGPPELDEESSFLNRHWRYSGAQDPSKGTFLTPYAVNPQELNISQNQPFLMTTTTDNSWIPHSGASFHSSYAARPLPLDVCARYFDFDDSAVGNPNPDQADELVTTTETANSNDSSEEDRLNANPYNSLLYQCLLDAPHHERQLKEIYDWFKENTQKRHMPNEQAWKNSIRHNLSMNEAFQKGSRSDPETGKKNMWSLTDNALLSGIQPTTRYRKQERSSKQNNHTRGASYASPQRQASGARGGRAARQSNRRSNLRNGNNRFKARDSSTCDSGSSARNSTGPNTPRSAPSRPSPSPAVPNCYQFSPVHQVKQTIPEDTTPYPPHDDPYVPSPYSIQASGQYALPDYQPPSLGVHDLSCFGSQYEEPQLWQMKARPCGLGGTYQFSTPALQSTMSTPMAGNRHLAVDNIWHSTGVQPHETQYLTPWQQAVSINSHQQRNQDLSITQQRLTEMDHYDNRTHQPIAMPPQGRSLSATIDPSLFQHQHGQEASEQQVGTGNKLTELTNAICCPAELEPEILCDVLAPANPITSQNFPNQTSLNSTADEQPYPLSGSAEGMPDSISRDSDLAAFPSMDTDGVCGFDPNFDFSSWDPNITEDTVNYE